MFPKSAFLKKKYIRIAMNRSSYMNENICGKLRAKGRFSLSVFVHTGG